MWLSTLDFLYIVLSICIIVLTVFICWGIYYGIRIIKSIFNIIDQTQESLKRLENAFLETKERIENSFSAIKITTEAVKAILEFFTKKRKKNFFDSDERDL